MKNQLLEDFGDSQSPLPVRPVRPVRPVQSLASSAPPAAAAEPGPRQRAGVWRSRDGSAPPPPWAQSTLAPEPPPSKPAIAPGIASFSSPHPDWARPLAPEPAPWTERWGRKALGWTAGLAVMTAVLAAAAWMYRDTQVESTLAVVAGHTPAPAAATAAVAIPETAAVAAEPPPLRMLPPEAVAALPAIAPPEETPVLKKAPERRVIAAAPARKARPVVKKPAPKPLRERVLVRASTPARVVSPPRAAVEEPAPPPVDNPLTETLRLCRAAGYHATACLKRGCEATRFGLVCRG